MIYEPWAVRLENVRVGYPERLVLDSVSTDLPATRTTAIVGPNGAGKSTLLDALAGIRPVLSGRITRTSQLRPAYVVQRSQVSDTLPITVRATVEMGRWAQRGPWRKLTGDDHRIVDECLECLGLTTLARRGIGALSGGQRQRTLVAQGLAQRSDLLLLDEPAAGLDIEARTMIEQALDGALEDGATIVRITHDPAIAQRADRCLVLADGRLVADGPPTEALRAGAMAMTGFTVGPDPVA